MLRAIPPGWERRTHALVALARAVVVLVAWLAAAAFGVSTISVARAQPACPPACTGKTLTTPNFSHADLTNAHFDGATIVGANFIRANLTGADFTGATFQSAPGNPAQTPDFTFANLTNAKFVGAKFDSPTYFTYAILTCADFSNTVLTSGNAVFGDDPIFYDFSATCRVKFQGTTMNCDFIDQWRLFDLTNANIAACLGDLAGRNFSDAQMSGVSFASAILDGASFANAHLTQAIFDNASLQCATTANGGSQCVDFSNAQLQGAVLNNANLSGASLYGAFLSNDVNGNITQAASLRQAHLKNVNLAFSQLSGVDFGFANFYGSLAANPGGCGTSGVNKGGFTNSCASAFHANMTDTKFGDAYLYGVDFREASIAGADFTQAVVAGANFSAATIGADPNSGAVTTFNRAYLQGTNLDQATVSQADLTDAFVDFRSGGNLVAIDLDGTDHNQFACSNPSTCTPPTGQDVCVYVHYPVTTVPSGNTTITCPHGLPAGPSGCGVADPAGSNTRWNSRLTIGTPPDPGPPPGWYTNDATFTPKAPPAAECNGRGKLARVLNW